MADQAWINTRIEELEEKADYIPFVSMGPGYREFEDDGGPDNAMIDCYEASQSTRLMEIIHWSDAQESGYPYTPFKHRAFWSR